MCLLCLNLESHEPWEFTHTTSKGQNSPSPIPISGEKHQETTAEQQDTCFPISPHFYKYLYIFFTRKAAPLGEESGFCLPCKVHPLFKANSPVQHKQGLLKTFSSKTIATTFDVFTALALPHCLIIMFYNIFSPSPQAPFQVPQLWNSWLHHPSFCIQWDTMERIPRDLF